LINLVFEVLGAGLSLWNNKEKRKYIDKLIKLKKDYYEEYNKELCDHAILDNIEFELRTLCKSFGSEARIAETAIE